MRRKFLEERLAVEVELTLPNGFDATGPLAPLVGYPAELVGVSNRSLPAADERSAHDHLPQVDGLGAGGALLWVTVGDYAYDGGAPELTGPKGRLDAGRIRARPARQVGFVPPLNEGDSPASTHRWPGYHQWSRVIPISEHHYLTLYAWTQETEEIRRTERPPEALAAAVGSMEVRDYS